MNTSLVIPPDLESKAKAEAKHLSTQVSKVVNITSDATDAEAIDFIATVIKPNVQHIRQILDPIIAAQHALHKQTLATRDKLLRPFLLAEDSIKAASGKWYMNKIEKQKQERAKLELAMMEEIERQALAEAEEKFEAGDDEGGHKVLADYMEAPPPVVALEMVKPKSAEGASVRMFRRFRIVDESKISRYFLRPDLKKIQAAVSNLGKTSEATVGGIEYYEEPNIAVKGKP